MRLDDTIEALAPHVEARWRERFVTELSPHGAGMPTVAGALVGVETHCRESGRRSAPEPWSAPRRPSR